jgi:osmotically inducible lipoprotein OsmE
VDVTDVVCGETLDCAEAVRTDEADYVRFDSRSAATEFAATLADGFVMHYIVMDFAGKTATKEQQQWAMERLAGAWQDYDGPYPER